MKRLCLFAVGLAGFVVGCGEQQAPTENSLAPNFASAAGTIRINVVLKRPATSAQLSELGKYGSVLDRIVEINALQMKVKGTAALDAIRALPFVAAASADRERKIPPQVSIPLADFAGGLSTFNLDAINVTNFGANPPRRRVSQTGVGVYVAVLDTGLLDRWRYFFPIARIATQFAKSFGGAPDNSGSPNVSEQPNKWERDTHGHGTHVTSIILGSLLGTVPLNGVAPQATVIPVKVLNQNGSGSSFVVAHGIAYIGALKAGPLQNSPVVINLSLGGPELDASEEAAIDFAIAQGVVVVAAAGNEGTAGMSFPGAYPPVISAAAAGWKDQWKACGGGAPVFVNWWVACDVPDPTVGGDLFIENFSSRELSGQDLDVAAPGAWVVGPFAAGALGQLSFFFVGGTSQASPHVAGLAALLLQQDPTRSQSDIDAILENTAVPIPAGSASVFDPNLNAFETLSWGNDATGAGLINAAAALGAP
ncbi:MAG TPA: S8 family serine peptidase [Gemmatimonadales bacterium]|nr:S8 family serine peptidase [Gemmatimonadales bacterium]